MRKLIFSLLLWSLAISAPRVWADDAVDSNEANTELYHELVLADGPVAYWRLDGDQTDAVSSVAANDQNPTLPGKVAGRVELGSAGPRPKRYPAFASENAAAQFDGRAGFIRVSDPGDDSPLDFDVGDSITLEAWVDVRDLANNQQIYIVGKGRTNNSGVARENQNYALRLRGIGSTAHVSFLFRRRDQEGSTGEYHRFNSSQGFPVASGWHHVAVSYTFGQGDSIRAYIDGAEVGGKWDMGGPTAEPPVVDDDELWIGSSLGGQGSSTFNGRIDEVAIYRHVLSPERIKLRYRATAPDPDAFVRGLKDLPDDAVVAEVFERIPDRTWTFDLVEPGESYLIPSLALTRTAKKYTDSGVIADRSNPHLLRLQGKQNLAAGEYRLLLRAKSAARLFIDGRIVAQTEFMSRNASGHEDVPELAAPQDENLWPLPPGHQEQIVTIQLDEGPHAFRVDTIVGGSGLRAESGTLCVGIAAAGEPFTLLAPQSGAAVALTDEGWAAFVEREYVDLARIDAKRRASVSPDIEEYWNTRHEMAREAMLSRKPLAPPQVSADLPVNNAIDRFIGRRLQDAGARPAPLTDDAAFLRRVTLDVTGVLPTRQEIAEFAANKSPERRAHVIDRLLENPRWADNWMGYWQDVLAENPGILKPKLNNTGPFRWWIYESLLDNKPLDRFVTELVAMEGSQYDGGPGGFAMATQNDSPMAAKAHVIAKAFLGVDLTCARCHDAPYHPYLQEELFNLAAMLDRRTIALPESSTVPVAPGARQPLVTISLKPGAKIAPEWPFASLAPAKLPEQLLTAKADAREQLAAIITSPENERFAQVAVNRLWKRYLGVGIVEPVDDWFDAEPSHPELLDWLAREFVANGYDLKHVARLILNSHAYQRQVVAELAGGSSAEERLFASPARRRMTAEQIVDSLFAAAGKQLRSEELTLDPEGRRPADTFLNLGVPRSAWEFTSLSNERDRPALALPMAQSVVDVLLVFGWRDSRPNPLTEREQEPTVLQPLIMANGIVANRIAQLSDDSEITALCLENQPVDELVDDVFLQLLSRRPADEEREAIVAMLREGYSERIVPEEQVKAAEPKTRRNAVSWSNHLSAEATRIKLELERAARAGDPPTGRLQPDWRERMEDVVWALVNSPEYVFLP